MAMTTSQVAVGSFFRPNLILKIVTPMQPKSTINFNPSIRVSSTSYHEPFMYSHIMKTPDFVPNSKNGGDFSDIDVNRDDFGDSDEFEFPDLIDFFVFEGTNEVPFDYSIFPFDLQLPHYQGIRFVGLAKEAMAQLSGVPPFASGRSDDGLKWHCSSSCGFNKDGVLHHYVQRTLNDSNRHLLSVCSSENHEEGGRVLALKKIHMVQLRVKTVFWTLNYMKDKNIYDVQENVRKVNSDGRGGEKVEEWKSGYHALELGQIFEGYLKKERKMVKKKYSSGKTVTYESYTKEDFYGNDLYKRSEQFIEWLDSSGIGMRQKLEWDASNEGSQQHSWAEVIDGAGSVLHCGTSNGDHWDFCVPGDKI